jgi:hypothetical protein
MLTRPSLLVRSAVFAGTCTIAGYIHMLSLLCFPLTRKIKKGVQMKRSQNARKMKAIAKAVSKNEQSEEKIHKAKSKKTRIQSAKSLYD